MSTYWKYSGAFRHISRPSLVDNVVSDFDIFTVDDVTGFEITALKLHTFFCLTTISKISNEVLNQNIFDFNIYLTLAAWL